VTIDRVAAVHAHISEAVVRSTASSTLSPREQEKLLAQSCAEACDLLGDWLNDDPWWLGQRPSDGTIADAVPDQQHFVRFLGPMFADALSMASSRGLAVPASYLDDARRRVAETARRHAAMTRADLFETARRRVHALRTEVCSLAQDLRTSSSRRHRALRVLRNVQQLLVSIALPVVLAMAAAGPHQVSQDISAWAHDAASVLVIHEVAHQAQPNLQIVPPHPGPRLR
jgi:hypothetical protein